MHLSFALSAVLGVAFTRAAFTPRATVCNGYPELCDRSYGQVTFVGAHNSYAVGINNLATNQDYDVTQQLNDGVRLLQMQIHSKNGVPQLCHSTCVLLDAGPLVDYFVKVKTWMDANPSDVVTLLIVNSANFRPDVLAPLFEQSGLAELSYTPEQAALQFTAWPSLGALIDSGKRLVTFLDNSADYAVVPYIIDQFSNVWETPFNVVSPDAFDCTVDRTNGDVNTQMFLINHYLDKVVFGNPAPDRSRANVTNAATGEGSLGAEVDLCQSMYSRAPNFLLLNFYEYGGGSAFVVAAAANGVSYTIPASLAVPIDEATGEPIDGSSSGNSNSSNPSDTKPNTTVTKLNGSLSQFSISSTLVFGVAGLITLMA